MSAYWNLYDSVTPADIDAAAPESDITCEWCGYRAEEGDVVCTAKGLFHFACADFINRRGLERRRQ